MNRRAYLATTLAALPSVSGCSSVDFGGDGEPTATGSRKGKPVMLPSLLSIEDRYDEGRTRFSGDGDSTTEPVETTGQATAVTWEYTGSEHFAIRLVDADGEEAAYPASKYGRSSGARVFPLPAGQYRLEIEARGSWNLVVAEPEPSESAMRALPAEATGSADDVVGPITLNGDTAVSARHDGEDRFRVSAIDMWGTNVGDSEPIINENGDFDGEGTARYPGDVWVDVEADGEWSLAFSEAES